MCLFFTLALHTINTAKISMMSDLGTINNTQATEVQDHMRWRKMERKEKGKREISKHGCGDKKGNQ